MKWHVAYTTKAGKDLIDILCYIRDDLQEPDTAIKQVGRIVAQIDKLDEMPGRFRRYSDYPEKGRHIHVVTVDHYLVFYVIDKAAHEVRILNIKYGGRDLHNLLDN